MVEYGIGTLAAWGTAEWGTYAAWGTATLGMAASALLLSCCWPGPFSPTCRPLYCNHNAIQFRANSVKRCGHALHVHAHKTELTLCAYSRPLSSTCGVHMAKAAVAVAVALTWQQRRRRCTVATAAVVVCVTAAVTAAAAHTWHHPHALL